MKIGKRKVMLSGKRTEGMLHLDPRAKLVQQGFEIKLGTNRLIKAIRAVEKRNGTPPAHLTQATLIRLAQNPMVREELAHRKAMHDELAQNREMRDTLKADMKLIRSGPDFGAKKEVMKRMRSHLALTRKRLKTKKV